MFTTNSFTELSAFISPSVMRVYIVVMIILGAGGTIYDVMRKTSTRYFRKSMRKSKANGATPAIWPLFW